MTAVDEMIAPQARGFEAPDAEGIPAFMDRIQRNLHLFGRYGITMFAISRARHRACGDLAARVKGVPLHRLIGTSKRARISGLREPASDRNAGSRCRRMPDRHAGVATQQSSCMRRPTPAVFCGAAGDRRQRPADGRHELPFWTERRRSHSRKLVERAAPMFLEEPVVAARGTSRTLAEVRVKRWAQYRRRRECLYGPSISPDDDRGAP